MSDSKSASAGPIVDTESPWLGLLPYSEDNHRFFFGREEEVREMFVRVRDNSLTVLYGQSGLGKSSLLGAGLIPKLRAEGYSPLLIRLRFSSGFEPLLEQIKSTIGKSIVGPARIGMDIDPVRRRPTLWEMFHDQSLGCGRFNKMPPVLIFDQFEEIFTLGPFGRKEEIAALAVELSDLAENRPPLVVRDELRIDQGMSERLDFTSSSVRMIFTLREDLLFHLDAWKSSFPSVMRNRMILKRLSGVQALRAVVGPGRLDRAENARLVSDEVGARIVCFVARRPVDTPLNTIEAVPPLLSLLCYELNESRIASNASFITESQVDVQSRDILQKFYNRAFENLETLVQKTIMKFVEEVLVSSLGRRNQIAFDEAVAILKNEGLREESANKALRQLVDSRLLCSEERDGVPRLELTHDLLCPLVVESRNVRRATIESVKKNLHESRASPIETRVQYATLIFGSLTTIFAGLIAIKESNNLVMMSLDIAIRFNRMVWEVESPGIARSGHVFELIFIIITGILIVVGLPRHRPIPSFIMSIFGILAFGLVGVLAAHYCKIWFPWSVAAFLQIPLALFWTTAAQLQIEQFYRKKLVAETSEMRSAFARYISPQMLKRLTGEGFNTHLGGEKIEAAIMFTDIEAFPDMCERVGDPQRIVETLNGYFELITGSIFDADGVIIKFIGDAIFAAWGAPLPDPGGPLKAARAAWQIHQSGQLLVDGQELRTRIGLHFGEVVAGNLGSNRRVDYALIGDAVNLASRLNDLNKQLGTYILISGAVQAFLDNEFLTRRVGKFLVNGRMEAIVIHELLGPFNENQETEWIDEYGLALEALDKGDTANSLEHFSKVNAMRGKNGDGPSRFFHELLIAGTPIHNGVVELGRK